MTRDRDDRYDNSRDDRFDRQGQGRGVGRPGDMNDRYGHYDYGSMPMDPASGMQQGGQRYGQSSGQGYDRDQRDYSDRGYGGGMGSMGMGRSYSEDQGRYRSMGGQDYGRQGMGQDYGRQDYGRQSSGMGSYDDRSGMGSMGYGQRGMGGAALRLDQLARATFASGCTGDVRGFDVNLS